jgi:hypothetical protein
LFTRDIMLATHLLLEQSLEKECNNTCSLLYAFMVCTGTTLL